MTDALLRDLNPAQARAVTWTGGPLLVLAGAGTGKTRVVTHRIAWLLQDGGLKPWSILAMTFTNKAAREMRERVDRLLGGGDHAVTLGTFHSVAARLLRGFADRLGYEPGFTIIDTDDQLRLLKRLLREERPHAAARDLEADAKTARRLAEEAMREGLRPAAKGTLPRDRDLSWVGPLLRRYAQAKRASQLMDFDDLLMNLLQLLREDELVRGVLTARYRHVLVDEFQDTNRLQLELVRAFTAGGAGLTVVGDDDQSIYGWRGARVENLLDLGTVYPGLEVVPLEENYRSTQTILTAAYHAIRRNPHLREKRLVTRQGEGEAIRVLACETEADEADKVADAVLALRRGGVSASAIAVFFRTNAQSRAFEARFRRGRIPHRVVGGQRFYERLEIRDALAFARLVANPSDRVAFERIVNTPPRGIGEQTVSAILATLAGTDPPPVLDAARAWAATTGGRAGAAVARFTSLVDGLAAVPAGADLVALFNAILQQTGYLARLEAEGTLESEGRRENLSALVTSVAEYAAREPAPTLRGYLESVSLQTDTDEWDEGEGAVALMTVHAAKGLEFDAVFVTGLEEGLFPHLWSEGERGVEEERRLFHVAITRARRRLWFTHARTRARFGQWQYATPSPFLTDIPRHLLSGAGPLRRRSLLARLGEEGTWVDTSTSQIPPEDE
ncbi:MAG: UvrD-helicase domain-containing protein [Deltaproteobacteria bacterium]|nr:UvrD-helicase domain-containing protein [Deltaproteobacteria bacterium]